MDKITEILSQKRNFSRKSTLIYSFILKKVWKRCSCTYEDAQENGLDIEANLYDETSGVLKVLHDTFELEICARFRIEQINDNLFKDGIYPIIDTIVKSMNKKSLKWRRPLPM